jgi:hypothetical protein
MESGEAIVEDAHGVGQTPAIAEIVAGVQNGAHGLPMPPVRAFIECLSLSKIGIA